MDFSPTEAQQDLAKLTRDILADNADAWPQLATSGVLAAALPESAGGNDFGLLEQCAVLVELGRTAAQTPYLDSIVLAASALTEFGPRALAEQWAAPAATGAATLTAALGGNVTATETATGWHLTGTVTAVPYAATADAILVSAGDAVFLVTPADSGVGTTEQQLVDLSPAAQLDLDTDVPAERRLGGNCAAWLANRAAIGLSAHQLGVTERALELTAEHAKTRVQFDRPIGTFQAVAQRIADAYIDVEAIRLTLWQAAWRASEDLPCDAEVATAKFWAADGGHRIAHTAVHIHGGMGIDTDHPMHKYFLAAKHNEFHLGGATDQLRQLGLLL